MYNKLQKLQPKLRELGFETNTSITSYVEDCINSGYRLTHNFSLFTYLYLCEIQKWLRDIHNIDILVEFGLSKPLNYGTFVKDSWCYKEGLEINSFSTYEEALLEGIIKSLEIIK